MTILLTRSVQGRRQTRDTVEPDRPKKIHLGLGLAEPELLGAVVIFSTDAELISFRAAKHQDSVVETFRQRLAQSLYPTKAALMTSVGFHSEEEILRKGGYYRYFN